MTPLTPQAAGRAIVGLGHLVIHATDNGDTATAAHAADLIAELALALVAAESEPTLAQSCLSEIAALLDQPSR